ncbi:hypothetical protein ACFQ9X_39715 [Catenulispora yoronensis]
MKRWWDGLGSDQQNTLLTTDAAEIGALDGVPAAERDIANRSVLSACGSRRRSSSTT